MFYDSEPFFIRTVVSISPIFSQLHEYSHLALLPWDTLIHIKTEIKNVNMKFCFKNSKKINQKSPQFSKSL